ncbi:MAG TPA: protein kinase [Kofleriaceae bacterium]|nr:protein kinase [Kofleriaceae bacterium]
MPLAIDAAIAPGTTLGGRYQVQRRLGVGGMGSVWCVHDNRTDEDVALKVLPPQAGTDALTRFRREVTLARRIAHPNVCRVFDLGDPSGLHVLTMELIEGESLRTRLARGPLPWTEARRVIEDLLAGLAAVHAAGVVHRDIKPENILIAASGRAVIVDFGLAWAPTTQAATAPEVGTPQYMAPEQLSGGAVDARSDVFAAGIAIQEILDGRPPFEGATAALVTSAILRDPPRPLEGKQVPAGVRAAVAQVIARALGHDREARQVDAGELREEWLAALAGPPAPAPTRRAGARIGSVSRAGAAALALIGATAAITLSVTRQGEPLAGLTAMTLATDPGRGAAIAPPPDPLASSFAKPPSFVIVPPWEAGRSHTVLQAYGTYQHQNTNSTERVNDFHALDFDLELDEAVYPIADGTVIYAGPATGGWEGFGNIVVLDHAVGTTRYQSLYAHLHSVADVSGAVSTSTIIGRAGRSGSGTSRVALHLAIYRGASFAADDPNGIGPYGGETVLPEPFASCTKSGATCARLVTGDVLLKSAAP